jgi:hypothetical protein
MLTNKKVTVIKYHQSTFNQNYTSVNEAAQNTKKNLFMTKLRANVLIQGSLSGKVCSKDTSQ